jgi:peroxiredoxin
VKRKHLRARVAVLLLGFAAPWQLPAADPGLIGRAAPEFVLPAFGGSNVRLSEFRGEVVALSFWSSRCGDCAAQLAALSDVLATYRSAGLVTLGVSVDDDLERAGRYAREQPVGFPLLVDRMKAVSRAFGIDRLPSIVLIDRSGVVRYVYRDFQASDSTYVTRLRGLLDDAPGAP